MQTQVPDSRDANFIMIMKGQILKGRNPLRAGGPVNAKQEDNI